MRCYNTKGYADGGPVKAKKKKKHDPEVVREDVELERMRTYRNAARELIGQKNMDEYRGWDPPGLYHDRAIPAGQEAVSDLRKRNLTGGMKDGGPVKKANPFMPRADEAEKTGKQGFSRADRFGKKKKNSKRKFI